ncbi:ferredoxin [Acrocarpospora pleiomorpha]|uniref:Ferredoxin n=1 Tax=Acrocarpospora pleiomorpha TaxID=90975 RepID=A0A5M3Y1V2_9ACTN|nr:2Fe-2S iron-sulfur cluster-binding protein [Acrocarpospora pleiomorpha]GES24698.1 ferredoxin [Acrocarpospora pleiomorpha]
MTDIIFRIGDESRTIDVADGVSLMKAAVEADIPGIIGECGGNAMCATCHIYTAETDGGRLPAVSDDEDEMLDCTASDRRPGSRLSCQLVAAPALDGMVVEVPPEQV